MGTGLLSPASSYFLKHTGTIRIWPKYSRIPSSGSGMKLKWLIFFLHARSRSISSDWDLIVSCHWAFSSSAQHPDWLPAGGPGLGCMPRRRTVSSAAVSLFVPRYENCCHLAFPYTFQNETKWTGAEARRGGDRRNWFLLIRAARGTLHLIWPSILRNDLNTFCVKRCTGLVRGALYCSCTW